MVAGCLRDEWRRDEDVTDNKSAHAA